MEVLYIVAVLGSQNLGVICVLPIKGVSYLALCMVEFWFLFIESRTKTDMSEIKELAKQIAQEDIELSDAEKQAVIDKAANINCEVKTKFNDLFNSWNEEISINPQTKYSSSTLAYTTLPQFKEMQAMGKNIIPLIMEKLLDEDNFFLLPLYDAIQTDSQLKISYKKGDAKILEGEQNKAKRTVRLWLSLSGN